MNKQFSLMYQLLMFASNEIPSEIELILRTNILQFLRLCTYKLLRIKIDNIEQKINSKQ